MFNFYIIDIKLKLENIQMYNLNSAELVQRLDSFETK